MAIGAVYGYKLRPAWFGRYRITGTIDELGTPGVYLVRLYRHDSGQIMRTTRSTPDGTWSFDWIPYLADGYYVTGHDHTAPLRNAAISDFVTPEPMPDV